MVLGIHHLDPRAKRFPESKNARGLRLVDIGRRGDDAPAALEQRGKAWVALFLSVPATGCEESRRRLAKHRPARAATLALPSRHR